MRYKKRATKLGIKGAGITRDKAEEMELPECVICLEQFSLNGEPVVKLNEIVFNETVIKTCKCACDIHASCAIMWVDKTRKCPICRTWCVISLNTGDHMVIFTPHQIEITRFGACRLFITKCSQVFLCIVVFAHMHLILYVFIFSFFASFLP